MKIKLYILIFLSAVTSLCSMGQTKLKSPQPVRAKININREWKFILGDSSGYQMTGYTDSNWKNINIPHNFSIPYFQAARWYTGYGWYRKHFNVPVNWKRKKMFIEFEGAFREAEIFINGKKVGESKSGYTGFSFDITSAAHAGDNVLAVRLSNSWNAQLAPLNGDHNFTGGIYRDVYLVATNPTHVTWYGTFVSTPKVSKTSGAANIKTEVKNDAAAASTYRLSTAIIDPSGKVVDRVSSSKRIGAGEIVEFNQDGHKIVSPKLWHPEHPFLYKAVSDLYSGNKIIDHYETDFGFRWVEWTADKGFFLNGEHYYFRGANVHQDHAGWASAVTNAGFGRDVQMVKDAGFDLIRGSHYPHDPAFADACDRLGMLFWSENNFWGAGGFAMGGSWFKRSPAYPVKEEDRINFENSLKNSLRDMIRVNRNHPSIITWSMSNEPFFSNKEDMDRIRGFLKELVLLSHQLDPTRKAAVGGVQRGDLDKTGDIAGYNGDGARLFINPGVPNVVSEYGSTISDRPGKYEPGFGDLAAQPQFTWRSGQAIWCAFDYGTHAGKLGHMGIIDYQRIPKRAWYWYRNEYKKIPPPEWPMDGEPAGLKLTADKTIIQHADGTDDIHVLVTVIDAKGKHISNSPGVTLTLISGPGEFPTGSAVTFSNQSDISILDGQAAIEFRSYYAGKSVIKASSPGLKDAYITIVSKGAPVFSGAKRQIVTERPYAKFIEQMEGQTKSDLTNFAYNKPTHVSTEIEGHSARFSDDQDNKTYWSSKAGDKKAWLTIDLENSVTVTGVKLLFPELANYKYKIQIMSDSDRWIDIVDYSSNILSATKIDHPITNVPNARALKISFTEIPEGTTALISEIEIYGHVYH